MKIKIEKKGFFKDTLIELVGEIVWNILMLIPRLIIRLISNIDPGGLKFF